MEIFLHDMNAVINANADDDGCGDEIEQIDMNTK